MSDDESEMNHGDNSLVSSLGRRIAGKVEQEAILEVYTEGKELIESITSDCLNKIENIESVVGTDSISCTKRISPRTIGKLDIDTLRRLVTDMSTSLRLCKKSFTDIEHKIGDISKNYDKMNERFVAVETHEVFVDQNKCLLEAGEACQRAGEVCEKVEPFMLRISEIDNELSEIREIHEVQLKELKALKSEFANQPPPPPPVLDYSLLKFPPLPDLPPVPPAPIISPATVRNQVRVSHDAMQRRTNVIVRGLPCPQSSDPVTVVRSFLNDCNIENFEWYQKDLVTAHILNRFNNACTIRIVFSNHWTVDNILNAAHMLKQGPALYRKVYLDKDRSPEEMKEYKKLLADRKQKITEQNGTRWIITEDGKVVENGHFTPFTN